VNESLSKDIEALGKLLGVTFEEHEVLTTAMVRKITGKVRFKNLNHFM
jgi:hypothetical protein